MELFRWFKYFSLSRLPRKYVAALIARTSVTAPKSPWYLVPSQWWLLRLTMTNVRYYAYGVRFALQRQTLIRGRIVIGNTSLQTGAHYVSVEFPQRK